MQGKFNPAIRLLEQNANSGVLSLTDHTMECLLQKHPKSVGELKKINRRLNNRLL